MKSLVTKEWLQKVLRIVENCPDCPTHVDGIYISPDVLNDVVIADLPPREPGAYHDNVPPPSDRPPTQAELDELEMEC